MSRELKIDLIFYRFIEMMRLMIQQKGETVSIYLFHYTLQWFPFPVGVIVAANQGDSIEGE
ncbi:MAG TPA: hypothetical protein DCS09_04890 [Porphyromonadaceae bacterium]|nr:hypothetical protein [Porphyromonadaceae bacterium]